MGDLRESLGGAVLEEREVTSPPSTSNPSPTAIGPLRWARAEEASQDIIQKVQPTTVSAERRRAVIDYVQRLIKGTLGLEVFPYGSVPLKTYLPDGDIDLTAFGCPMVEDALVNDMVSVLEGEDQNMAAEFTVKDVQLIRAEVKLVKCIVQNIVVDISFNQIGGLCTLCFLEQVDQLIGKDHLFKRSIILIKAWCYYESRILGAHHGLISTYALETLVLYIFHLFHSTLDGPLAVLYKFLDYFSKFDWETYCICLAGPVRISSLPEIVVEVPENDGGELLLTNDFLRYCVKMFSVSSRGYDMNSRTFQQKHLNIVDPLKENNNLGRSVSKGNFYRIRSAFTYGAKKLKRILLQSDDRIVDELHNFFANTLGRHGSGQRPDVQDLSPVASCNSFCQALPVSETDSSQSEVNSRTESGSPTDTHGDCTFDPYGSTDREDRDQEGAMDGCQYKQQPDSVGPGKGNALIHRLCGDATELASSITQGLKLSNDSPKFASSHSACNGEMKKGNLEKKLDTCEDKCLEQNHSNDDKDEDFVPVAIKDDHLALKALACSDGSHQLNLDQPSASGSGSQQPVNALLELSGDYDHYLSCLQFGRWCYESISTVPAMPISPPPLNPFQIKYSWNSQQPPKFKRNGFSYGGTNGVVPNQAFYTLNPMLAPNIAFGEMQKPRGTGTYFPNMSRRPQGYRPSAVKGRNQAPVRYHRANSWNGGMFTETQTLERNWHDLPQPQSGVDRSEIHQSYSPHGREYPNTNGVASHPEAVIEFGTVGHVTPVSPSSERSRQQKHLPLPSQHSNPSSPSPGLQQPKPYFSRDHDRAPVKSAYHLKDEEDFPPLSV
nr:uncharacterized protein LOC109159045 [Ipomoea batatas]